MQIRKQFSFDSTAEILERILDGGIVMSPMARLEVVERGVRGFRVVIASSNVVEVRRAA